MTHNAAMPLEPNTVELLLLLRRRRGWSRELLAKKIGPTVTARAVRSWEEGKRLPRENVRAVIEKFIEHQTRKDKA